MNPSFDPLAGLAGATRASIRSIWTHQADAEDGTPWRLWQRADGPDDAFLTRITLTYAPDVWRCHHNRGFGTPAQVAPALALSCASQLATAPDASAWINDFGDEVVVAGLRLRIATIDGDVATMADAGLVSNAVLQERIAKAIAVRAEVMS